MSDRSQKKKNLPWCHLFNNLSTPYHFKNKHLFCYLFLKKVQVHCARGCFVYVLYLFMPALRWRFKILLLTGRVRLPRIHSFPINWDSGSTISCESANHPAICGHSLRTELSLAMAPSSCRRSTQSRIYTKVVAAINLLPRISDFF